MDSDDSPETDTVIRARRHDDIDSCVALLAATHTANGYPVHWPADPRGWLAPGSLLAAWVAEHADMLAGHVALHAAVGDAAAPVWSAASGRPAEQLAVVSQLFVAPTTRGHGLGAALLAKAGAAARARGLLPALDVLDSDRAAIALYERAGWRRVASAPAPWAPSESGERFLHYYLAPGEDVE